MANPAIVISGIPGLKAFLDSITKSSSLYLDLEGKKLSRYGTLIILTVLVDTTGHVSLIDVQALGLAAFETRGANGKTLREILEDPAIPKRLWDVRNDADALWAHYQVRLAGVMDIQLLENASRRLNKTYLRGLDSAVQKDLTLTHMERARFQEIKKNVVSLMPTDIFARRPLSAETIQYCANDVVYLPALFDLYTKMINGQWMAKVVAESQRRVTTACGPVYDPHSETKKFGPWGR
jgi:exonuclease 3'-5' domain-containing protein 1